MLSKVLLQPLPSSVGRSAGMSAAVIHEHSGVLEGDKQGFALTFALVYSIYWVLRLAVPLVVSGVSEQGPRAFHGRDDSRPRRSAPPARRRRSLCSSQRLVHHVSWSASDGRDRVSLVHTTPLIAKGDNQ